MTTPCSWTRFQTVVSETPAKRPAASIDAPRAYALKAIRARAQGVFGYGITLLQSQPIAITTRSRPQIRDWEPQVAGLIYGTNRLEFAGCRGKRETRSPNLSALVPAVSSAGCDELVESFGWGVPVECFAWSSVEFTGDEVEVVLAVLVEVFAFG